MAHEEIESVEGLSETNAKINRAIDEHRDAIVYLIVSGFVLIVVGSICYLMKFSSGQTFFTIVLTAIILALLYKVKVSHEMAEARERRGVIKEGWMVTWADRWRHYMKAPKESTLLLVYGYYIVHEDGSIESIPDSFRLTFYKTNFAPHFFNPFIRGDMIIYQMVQEQYGEIVWADGTDRYMSAFERDLSALEVEA